MEHIKGKGFLLLEDQERSLLLFNDIPLRDKFEILIRALDNYDIDDEVYFFFIGVDFKELIEVIYNTYMSHSNLSGDELLNKLVSIYIEEYGNIDDGLRNPKESKQEFIKLLKS